MEIIIVHKQSHNLVYKKNLNRYNKNIQYIYYPMYFNDSIYEFLDLAETKPLYGGYETIQKCWSGEIFEIEYRFLLYKIDAFKNVSDIHLIKDIKPIKNKLIIYNEIFK